MEFYKNVSNGYIAGIGTGGWTEITPSEYNAIMSATILTSIQ